MNYTFKIKTVIVIRRGRGNKSRRTVKDEQNRCSIGLLHEVTGLNKIPLLVITATRFQRHQNSNCRGTTSCRV